MARKKSVRVLLFFAFFWAILSLFLGPWNVFRVRGMQKSVSSLQQEKESKNVELRSLERTQKEMEGLDGERDAAFRQGLTGEGDEVWYFDSAPSSSAAVPEGNDAEEGEEASPASSLPLWATALAALPCALLADHFTRRGGGEEDKDEESRDGDSQKG